MNPWNPHGQFLDIGGYAIYSTYSGEGIPAVVLDAGLGQSHSTWVRIQPALSEVTCVFSYDRAGVGRSDNGRLPRTSLNMVSELHRLIEKAGIRSPFILVGHSFGAINVQLYAKLFPSDVAGLVLIDPALEDHIERFEAVLSAEQFSQWKRELFDLRQEGTTMDDIVASMDQLKNAGPLPDMPVMIISAGQFGPLTASRADWPALELQNVLHQGHVQLARRLSKVQLLVVVDSFHYIHEQQPELVLEAITTMVESIRNTWT